MTNGDVQNGETLMYKGEMYQITIVTEVPIERTWWDIVSWFRPPFTEVEFTLRTKLTPEQCAFIVDNAQLIQTMMGRGHKVIDARFSKFIEEPHK